jgi:hypothetical protein
MPALIPAAYVALGGSLAGAAVGWERTVGRRTTSPPAPDRGCPPPRRPGCASTLIRGAACGLGVGAVAGGAHAWVHRVRGVSLYGPTLAIGAGVALVLGAGVVEFRRGRPVQPGPPPLSKIARWRVFVGVNLAAVVGPLILYILVFGPAAPMNVGPSSQLSPLATDLPLGSVTGLVVALIVAGATRGRPNQDIDSIEMTSREPSGALDSSAVEVGWETVDPYRRRAELVSASCTSGRGDWIRGELWLFDDGILRRSLGLAVTLAACSQPPSRIETSASFTSQEIDRITGANRRNVWVRRSQIIEASLSRGWCTSKLVLRLEDGSTRTFLYQRSAQAFGLLESRLHEWLGGDLAVSPPSVPDADERSRPPLAHGRGIGAIIAGTGGFAIVKGTQPNAGRWGWPLTMIGATAITCAAAAMAPNGPLARPRRLLVAPSTPGPQSPRAPSLRVRLLMAVCAGLISGIPIFVGVTRARTVWELDHRGIVTKGIVKHVYLDDQGASWLVTITVGNAEHDVFLENVVGRAGVGYAVPVRYDPAHPSSGVDARASGYSNWFVPVSFTAFGAACLAFGATGLRLRRRRGHLMQSPD